MKIDNVVSFSYVIGDGNSSEIGIKEGATTRLEGLGEVSGLQEAS